MLAQIDALNRGWKQAVCLYLALRLRGLRWRFLLVIAFGMVIASRFLFVAALYAAGLARPW